VVKVPKTIKIVQGARGSSHPQDTYYVPKKGIVVHKQNVCHIFNAKIVNLLPFSMTNRKLSDCSTKLQQN